jgi:hypothetical protein
MKKGATGGKKTAKGGKKTAKTATKTAPKTAAKKTTTGGKDVWYVYGIVRESFDPVRAPAGLDDTPVRVAKSGRIGALVSRLPGSGYSAQDIESNSGEVAWVSPRAMAHDRVLTWAQEHGGVIPLPMFSLWGSEDALSRSLADQATELARVFERVSGADEFGLRVHRRDDVMIGAIDDLDPEIAALRREAQAAPAGQRYLLERKLAEQGKSAVRAASQRMAKKIFGDLRAFARDALSRPPVPEAGRVPDATLVLNAAFLVDRKRLDEFRAAVGAHVRDYQPRGLAFDFTGPWPPYNFVGEDGGAVLRSGESR